MPDLMEYIRIQWTDIHHTRNQEWKILAIIGGVFAALFVKPMDLPLQIAITIFGLIICIMGIYISIAHWIIFYSKMRVIHECEKELGIEAVFHRGPLPVQGAIVLIYFLFTSILSGWLVWLLSSKFLISIIASASIFVAGLILCIVPNSPLRKAVTRSKEKPLTLKKESETKESKDDYDTKRLPLIAELNDLTKCLRLMGQKPLKLIAHELYENESMWDESKWSFASSDGKVIDKKLLLNPEDKFQFSIANEQSKQDFHVHHNVFEIYVSYSEMEIIYFSDGRERKLQIPKGALIIPPNISHKVRLYGPTFVFQSVIKEGNVHGDKEIRGEF